MTTTNQPIPTGILLVAHGTRDEQGFQVSQGLRNAVATRFPDRETRLAFVDVRAPSPSTVLNDWEVMDITLVPVFLGAGFHVRTDIPAALADHPHVRVTAPLGPEPEIINALADRWRRTGAEVDRLVLGAAGSSDPRSVAQTHRAAELLSEALDHPVSAAFCTAATPRVADVVDTRTGVIAHLLAPGHFHRRLLASGATAVSDPIGVHNRLVDLLERRIRDVTEPAPGPRWA